MLLEYIAGGELFTRLRIWHHFPNDVALFYTTEVLCALEYIHSLNFIYRDLKPENILIDEQGHVRIADFGFCKDVSNNKKSYTLCGTPEYLAPEVIKSEGQGKPVDWWALGILIFEMLHGHPPFYDHNPFRIYKKIMRGNYTFPSETDKHARRLIKKLLNPDQEKRLGSKNGAEEVKGMKWFRGVDFSLVLRKEITAPWTPNLRGPLDTSSFVEYEDDPSFLNPASEAVNRLFEDF